MRVLVLGGTGAMGEPLVRLLSKDDNEVYVTSRKKNFDTDHVRFIQGDAHDLPFVQSLLKKRFDAIVDFMIYPTAEFREKAPLFLDSTDQYLFLSSARVYAKSLIPITEDSPRLLDVSKDENYLKSDEYALAKARSENILYQSQQRNWTIIRPYITYNTSRLQLGVLELNAWAGRIQRLKYSKYNKFYLILPKDIAYKHTTMSHGNDVARAIADLIGNPFAIGETFNITGNDHMQWIEVANIYKNVIEELTGISVGLYMPENSIDMSKYIGCNYQFQYDRAYDRIFDNSKLINACNKYRISGLDDKTCQVNFIKMKDGLRQCVRDHFNLCNHTLLPLNCKFEAFIDRIVYKTRSLRKADFIEAGDFLRYLLYYYAKDVMFALKTIRNIR